MLFLCYDGLAMRNLDLGKMAEAESYFALAPQHGLNSEALGVLIRGEEVVHVHE